MLRFIRLISDPIITKYRNKIFPLLFFFVTENSQNHLHSTIVSIQLTPLEKIMRRKKSFLIV